MPCLLVFHITNAGLCGECETDSAVLPSLESFQSGMALPKVMFIFYEYFFKAMVGGAAWKKRFEEDVRFGTNILEAYTQATLENNYFAWVYEYVKENPGRTLKTEYDIAGDDNATNDDHRLFCGDLDHVEIAPAPQIGELANGIWQSWQRLSDSNKVSKLTS
jgi:hypothetical protein